MEQSQKDQINFYLTQFVSLANASFEQSNYKLQEYWKGQVMGIGKVVEVLNLDINMQYYFAELH